MSNDNAEDKKHFRMRIYGPEMYRLIKENIDSLCGCEEVSGDYGDMEQRQCEWCRVIERIERV